MADAIPSGAFEIGELKSSQRKDHPSNVNPTHDNGPPRRGERYGAADESEVNVWIVFRHSEGAGMHVGERHSRATGSSLSCRHTLSGRADTEAGWLRLRDSRARPRSPAAMKGERTVAQAASIHSGDADLGMSVWMCGLARNGIVGREPARRAISLGKPSIFAITRRTRRIFALPMQAACVEMKSGGAGRLGAVRQEEIGAGSAMKPQSYSRRDGVVHVDLNVHES